MEHDIACGILAGVFDPGAYVVTAESITETSPATGAKTVRKDWLKPNDVLGALTRMCVAARAAVASAPVRADASVGVKVQQTRDREAANARHLELKRQVYDVLLFRDVIGRATAAGVRLLFTPPTSTPIPAAPSSSAAQAARHVPRKSW